MTASVAVAAQHPKLRGAAWLAFALVARDLARGVALADVPLPDIIAEATVDAFAASTPRQRRAGRRR